tara:strand:+ start:1 stop:1119 length:1119 start_codon:yes stop_codon:yes gene_type:complete
MALTKVRGNAVDGGTISTETAGTNNLILGSTAGDSIASGGNYNVCIGDTAGTALTTGDNNVAIGFEALATEDAHGNNTAVGYRALKTLNAGAEGYNVAVGQDAGTSMTTGTTNTLIGVRAGDALTVGSDNVAIGYNALGSDLNGSRSVAIGRNALGTQEADATTVNNYYNVSVGDDAGAGTTTGYYNTFIGAQAGDGLQTGVNNVCVGFQSDTDNTSRTGAIALGSGIGTFAADNTFRVQGSGGVYHTGNTSSWNTTSDERIKKNITDSTVGLADINKIKVRNFEYRTADEITDSALQAYDKTQLAVSMSGKQVGCIAQELETVLPNAVIEDDRGVKNVQVDEIHWHMIKAIQELSAKNDALESRIKKLEDG